MLKLHFLRREIVTTLFIGRCHIQLYRKKMCKCFRVVMRRVRAQKIQYHKSGYSMVFRKRIAYLSWKTTGNVYVTFTGRPL